MILCALLDISSEPRGLQTILFVAEEIVDVINKFFNKFADDIKDAAAASL